eukprot:gene3483-3528_t
MGARGVSDGGYNRELFSQQRRPTAPKATTHLRAAIGTIALRVCEWSAERRNAIADSRAIRTSSLLARVTTFTTIFGAEAAVEGMKYLDKLDVYSVQELHAQLAA